MFGQRPHDDRAPNQPTLDQAFQELMQQYNLTSPGLTGPEAAIRERHRAEDQQLLDWRNQRMLELLPDKLERGIARCMLNAWHGESVTGESKTPVPVLSVRQVLHLADAIGFEPERLSHIHLTAANLLGQLTERALTLGKRQWEELRSPYQVLCSDCGAVQLDAAQYAAQAKKPYRGWRCPSCGGPAQFNYQFYAKRMTHLREAGRVTDKELLEPPETKQPPSSGET